ERGTGHPALAMAADPDAGDLAGGHGLDCRDRLVGDGARRGHPALGDLPHRPFRAARAPAGVGYPAGAAVAQSGVRDPLAVQARAPSPVPGLAHDLLGDADDDGGPPAVRGRDERLHRDRDALRGTRPVAAHRGAVPPLPGGGAGARALAREAPARLTVAPAMCCDMQTAAARRGKMGGPSVSGPPKLRAILTEPELEILSGVPEIAARGRFRDSELAGGGAACGARHRPAERARGRRARR